MAGVPRRPAPHPTPPSNPSKPLLQALQYTTERLWATAPDGTRVPISLVYRTDLARRDGTDPMLLDAYGRRDDSGCCRTLRGRPRRACRGKPGYRCMLVLLVRE